MTDGELRTPAAAGNFYGDELPRAERYVEWLATAGIERGLIGPREIPRLWQRHVLNCAVLSELLDGGSSVADIGSGAGLPGVAVAIARPDLRVVLIEPMLRRAEFLHETIELLGLESVTVVRARAEEYAPTDLFDDVTARAVAKMGALSEWSMPMLRPGGRLLALKGQSVRDELDRAKSAIRRTGAAECSIETVGADIVDPPTAVAVVTKAAQMKSRVQARRRDIR